MNQYLTDLVEKQKQGISNSICSVCSANPYVLEATLEHTLASDNYTLIESTSNQVNQYGGYTGMKPEDFYRFIYRLAERVGFPNEKLILGGDHLGPYPWRKEKATSAMSKACTLVRDYVKAGFSKIHLDASMHLGDDPGDRRQALEPELVAKRSAELCAAAEEVRLEDEKWPLYVIGTEVPVPGGTVEDEGAPEVTRVSDLEETISLTSSAFRRRGLESAWERVIAVVVQPGVEFGSDRVYPYEREKARALCAALSSYPNLVFEGHSTDYQTAEHLEQMAEDGIAILKVGPALTFAFREAVFLLSCIEGELFGDDPTIEPARVPETLERAMLAESKHWQPYYRGDERALRLAQRYSLYDRSRYYWSESTVQSALSKLLANLRRKQIPLSLLSQFFSAQYWKLRKGALDSDPKILIKERIKDILRMYPGNQDL